MAMNEYELKIFYRIKDLDLEHSAVCEILVKIVGEMYSIEDEVGVEEAVEYIKIWGGLL